MSFDVPSHVRSYFTYLLWNNWRFVRWVPFPPLLPFFTPLFLSLPPSPLPASSIPSRSSSSLPSLSLLFLKSLSLKTDNASLWVNSISKSCSIDVLVLFLILFYQIWDSKQPYWKKDISYLNSLVNHPRNVSMLWKDLSFVKSNIIIGLIYVHKLQTSSISNASLQLCVL